MTVESWASEPRNRKPPPLIHESRSPWLGFRFTATRITVRMLRGRADDRRPQGMADSPRLAVGLGSRMIELQEESKPMQVLAFCTSARPVPPCPRNGPGPGTTRVHARGNPGRDRDHRHPRGLATARRAISPRGVASGRLHEQFAAIRHCAPLVSLSISGLAGGKQRTGFLAPCVTLATA